MDSKLVLVRKALEGNSAIIIVGCLEVNSLSNSLSFGHTMDFYVAPKVNLYHAKTLQSFMLSLVPSLKPTMVDYFDQTDDELIFGKLSFDEDIGLETTHREITITDTELLSTVGFVEGIRVSDESRNVRRRTRVKLFPDLHQATLAYEGKPIRSMKQKSLFWSVLRFF